MIEFEQENELSPQGSVSEVLKEYLSKDGAPLETQLQNCVDAIVVYNKQREEFLAVLRILQETHNITLAIHNSTLRQIKFFPN